MHQTEPFLRLLLALVAHFDKIHVNVLIKSLKLDRAIEGLI